jgi:hypothetical protein
VKRYLVVSAIRHKTMTITCKVWSSNSLVFGFVRSLILIDTQCLFRSISRNEKRKDLMPTPMKPCDGSFNEETNRLLLSNVDRAQWLLHACARCGQMVGARIDKGRWSPEVHWPSVPRRPSPRSPVGGTQSKRETALPAKALRDGLSSDS